MRSSGGSSGNLNIYVGADWWTHLSTYDDHTPIFDISAGSTSVVLSIAGKDVDAAALDFARELAAQAARFAAEVERLHAQQHGTTGTPAAGDSTGEGEAA